MAKYNLKKKMILQTIRKSTIIARATFLTWCLSNLWISLTHWDNTFLDSKYIYRAVITRKVFLSTFGSPCTCTRICAKIPEFRILPLPLSFYKRFADHLLEHRQQPSFIHKFYLISTSVFILTDFIAYRS